MAQEKEPPYHGPVEILADGLECPSHVGLKRGMVVQLPDQFTWKFLAEGKVKKRPDVTIGGGPPPVPQPKGKAEKAPS